MKPSATKSAVRLTRRQTIMLSPATFAFLAFPSIRKLLGSAPDASQAVEQSLTWKQLLNEAIPLAQETVRLGSKDEIEYLEKLMTLAVRPGWLEDRQAQTSLLSKKKSKHGKVTQNLLYTEMPFLICLYELEDRGRIDAHNHPKYNAVTKVLGGQARLREFAFAAKQPAQSGAKFNVTELTDRIVKAGDFSAVTTQKANIHEITGAQGGFSFVDLFTFYGSPQPSRRILLDPVSTEASVHPRTYQARWGGVLS